LLVSFLMTGCGRTGDGQGQHELVRLDVVAFPITTHGATNLQIAKGDNQPFVATAHYSNGTFADVTDSVVWSSSSEEVGLIDSGGVMSGQGIGVTHIFASKDGVTSNAVEIEVTAAVLRSIQVNPGSLRLAKGQVEALEATAVYSDQTTSDISDEATWWVQSGSTVVNVSRGGKVQGLALGNTQVRAIKDGVT
ncbi:Ig-like domain-containing protein, partial [Aeromonas veronii]|uniref:Ig-like domain-containing protein n=1 Tax=Aeromonas veronii TaxID=654 RepID=UPI003D1DCA16